MACSRNTGRTVPGWIRDEVRRLEGAWPLLVLAGAEAAVLLVVFVSGVILWTSDSPVYYARP